MIVKDEHPWGNFLHARALGIKWLKEECQYTYQSIAESLSMDEEQVRLIYMSEIETETEDTDHA